MKIKDIVNSVNKSYANKSYVNIQNIAESMGIFDVWSDDERLSSYFIGNWNCSGTYVGYRVYFLDDNPVAITTQLGRKCSEVFEWLSIDAYNCVKKYLQSLQITEEDDSISLAVLDQEIGETYKIEFNGQIFDYQKSIPLYKGEKVSIIEMGKIGEYFSTEKNVKIKFIDESERWIELHELDFPFNLV